MTQWTQAVAKLQAQGQHYTLITVLSTKGSSPRDVGTKMVVAQDTCYGTIGGGALEHRATAIGRTMLTASNHSQHIETFNLSQDLKQCCGGVVTLLFESFAPANTSVVVFGAGHIGHELVPLLARLEFETHWFDSREDIFPEQIPENVTTHDLAQLELDVEGCPAQSIYLIMTHDHATDQALCEAILSRGDAQFCGLIGSRSKQLNFNKRLRKKGFSADEIDFITCPIGLPELTGKRPAEIAVSVAAQMLALRSAAEQSRDPGKPGKPDKQDEATDQIPAHTLTHENLLKAV